MGIYNVDSVFSEICDFDKEYKNNITNSKYIANDAILRSEKLEMMFNYLSLDELVELANKIDEEMEINPSLIINTFHEAVHGIIHIRKRNNK